MDSLSNNVSNIQDSLRSARERLNSLDTASKNIVATEVASVRSSLQNSLSKAQHAKLQMSSFLLLLENVEDPTTVNMAPQISWLARSLDDITASITQAEASADSALQSTMDCSYQVMDVGRDVEAQDDLLDECRSRAKDLASQAESSLASSEAILAQTQRDANTKEGEISIKTRQASEKKTRKAELDREITQKNGQIAETHRRRESKKESAGVGLVCTRICTSKRFD
jgi:chromosome segregation ATPase